MGGSFRILWSLFLSVGIGVTMVFAIHWFFSGTAFAFEEIESAIQYHSENHFFSERKFTTIPVKWLSEALSIREGIVFILYSLGILALIGMILWWVDRMTENRRGGWNAMVFYLSFPVLFLFFTPVYGYDEPVQWFFILLAIITLIRKELYYSIPFIMLAILARESTLLILPAFLWIAYQHYGVRTAKFVFTFVSLSIFVVLTRILMSGESHVEELYQRGYHIFSNFESFDRSFESLFSMIAVLLIPIYFAITRKERNWELFGFSLWIPFLITLVLNTSIVFFTGYARESRLFALPWLFLWPVFYQVSVFRLTKIRQIVKVKRLVLGLICLLASILMVNAWYRPTIGNGGEGLFAIHLYLSIIFISLESAMRKQGARNLEA